MLMGTAILSTRLSNGLGSYGKQWAKLLCFQGRRCKSHDATTLKGVKEVLDEALSERDGLEWHPFKVGSYNAVISQPMKLDFNDDVLSVVVLNTPSFFGSAFKRWLQSVQVHGEDVRHILLKVGHNPMRNFFEEKFSQIEKSFLPGKVVPICDFEPLSTRPPKVSLPACGHVSGAAYFYRPSAKLKKEYMGVSLHPKYGGHFSYRGVIVFPECHLPSDFKETTPEQVLKNEEEIDEAIVLFNEHARDGRYRDYGNPVERYSDLQLKFFRTPPAGRWDLIAHWFNNKPSS